MVSKGKATKGSAQAINYALNDKGLAVELDRNLIAGNNGSEILQEFRDIQATNTRCQNNTYSIVLSPDNSRSFSPDQMREFGQEQLKNLGLSDHQYLMTLHTSTETPHIHILVNRIDLSGKAHSDSYFSKKCQSSAEQIARSHGLITAKEIQSIHQKEIGPIKAEILKSHEFARSKSKTFEEYKDYMYAKGVTVEPTINKGGILQGYKLKHRSSNLTFKASEISKDVGLKSLVQKNIQFQNPIPEILKKHIPTPLKIAKKIVEGIVQSL